MDKKGSKRKEREKKVREKNQLRQEKNLEQRRQEEKSAKLFDQDDRLQERLACEVLLSTVGISVDSHTLGEAKSFLKRLKRLGDEFDVLGEYLDDLFALAKGKIPRRYSAKSGVDYLAHLVVRSMRGLLETFEKMTGPLLNTRIGQWVCGTDDVDGKLHTAGEGKQTEIQAYAEQCRRSFNKIWPDDQNLGDDGGGEADDDLNYQFALQSVIETVTRPLDKARQWQLGVPTDFYRDIIQVATELSVSSTLFFLRQLYATMTAGKLHPILQQKNDALGMIRFRHVLQLEPENYLPDPEYLEEQKALAQRLNQLDGGASVLQILELLHAAGSSYVDALAKLERLGTGQHTFGIAIEMLSTSDEWGTFLLDLCCEHPDFIGAYETLRATHHSPEESARFLCDFGDYQIGTTTLSQVIQHHRRRPEAVRLLVKNALSFCCGEGANDMVALLDDLPKSTKELRYYMGFATTEEPYKQLAVLRYLKDRGVDGLETFAENLQRHRDDRVGRMLRETDNHALISTVGAKAEPEATDATQPWRIVPSFDLIIRYNLASEIMDLSTEAVSLLDTVLCRLRGSRFEPILLGQSHLRQQFIARLRHGEYQTATALSNLPSDGNPYLVLKSILAPATMVPPTTVERRPAYERMVLISAGVDTETIAHLKEQLGIPIHEISVEAAGTKFAAIRRGDVVVYETTRTSHLAYYRAKNLATRRGATFRHAARIHRDALVAIVRS